MLPAREAEYAIKALHRNSEGFRRLGMFLIFYALYFALVFTGFDIPFERAVEQGLRSHVDSVGMKRFHEKYNSGCFCMWVSNQAVIISGEPDRMA